MSPRRRRLVKTARAALAETDAAAAQSWVKRYETRDDFAADTGPVVRDALLAPGQALYDAARRRVADLLDATEGLTGRDVVVEIVCNGRQAVVRVSRSGATRTTVTVTIKAGTA